MSEEEVVKNLKEYKEEVSALLDTAFARAAVDGQAYAQRNRKWKDRTGQARAGLRGTGERVNDHTWEVVIAHTAAHGVQLELAHGRRYAILERAVRRASRSFHDFMRAAGFQGGASPGGEGE